MTPSSPRAARRSDATRNAARLVASARELFESEGTEVGLDRIARQAGVGNATLYRHFPTRADLLVAVYADEVKDLCNHGEQLLGDPAAGAAMFRWLELFVVHVMTKRALALAATQAPGDRRSQLFDEWHAAIRRIATHLLRHAQAQGSVDSTVKVADVLALASGAALGATSRTQARRLVRLLRTGLQDGS